MRSIADDRIRVRTNTNVFSSNSEPRTSVSIPTRIPPPPLASTLYAQAPRRGVLKTVTHHFRPFSFHFQIVQLARGLFRAPACHKRYACANGDNQSLISCFTIRSSVQFQSAHCLVVTCKHYPSGQGGGKGGGMARGGGGRMGKGMIA